MSVYAKNLRTISETLPLNGDILELVHDEHRTYLMVEDVTGNEDIDLRFWIGPILPPNDLTKWPSVAYLPLQFPEGVAGPILLVEPASLTTELVILSSQDEETRIYAPKDVYLTRTLLTTEAGDPLVTHYGADLLYHLL